MRRLYSIEAFHGMLEVARLHGHMDGGAVMVGTYTLSSMTAGERD